MEKAEDTKTLKSSFLQSLACRSKFFCKKSKKQILRDKLAARFEKELDIRSFVGVHTNLAILLSVLLSKE